MIDSISEATNIITEISYINIFKYYFGIAISLSLVCYILCIYNIIQDKKLLYFIEKLLPGERLWALKKKLTNVSFSSDALPDRWIKKRIRHHYCIIFAITIWLAISFAVAVFIVLRKVL